MGGGGLSVVLTRSILASLCLRRRRLCRRINCDEELCSVELLSLKKENSEEQNKHLYYARHVNQ